LAKDNDTSAIVRLPDLSSTTSLEQFLKQPYSTIAAVVTSVLASGRSEAVLAAGRILQAAFIGHTVEQVGKEISTLIEKGKLKEDYANESVGFKSLQELVEFIDAETPDEDRLRGVKAMFYAVNSAETRENERILMYELLRLAKRLSGSQVRLLAVVYKIVEEKHGEMMNIDHWFRQVSAHIGHEIRPLIELDEIELISLKLIEQRREVVTGMVTRTARLTDLGVKFCECLKNYDETVQG
jgi:hypothetical protein